MLPMMFHNYTYRHNGISYPFYSLKLVVIPIIKALCTVGSMRTLNFTTIFITLMGPIVHLTVTTRLIMASCD